MSVQPDAETTKVNHSTSRNERLQTPEETQYPASIHFAFIAGILLPLTVIPYFIARRQTSRLQGRLKETENVVKVLQRELRVTALELDKIKAEQAFRASQTDEMHAAVDELKTGFSRFQTDGARAQKSFQEYMVALERQVDTSRSSHFKAFRDVGQSLNNIATLVEEMGTNPFKFTSLGRREKNSEAVAQLRSAASRLQQHPDKKQV